jgi:hypothetical protein
MLAPVPSGPKLQSYSPKTAAMSAYASEYPPLEFDVAYKEFFEGFYRISDTPDAHDKYVQHFTKDAVLVMASKRVQGSNGTPVLNICIYELIPVLRNPRNAQSYVGEGC